MQPERLTAMRGGFHSILPGISPRIVYNCGSECSSREIPRCMLQSDRNISVVIAADVRFGKLFSHDCRNDLNSEFDGIFEQSRNTGYQNIKDDCFLLKSTSPPTARTIHSAWVNVGNHGAESKKENKSHDQDVDPGPRQPTDPVFSTECSSIA